jgi:DNA-binding NtrC family response regulator
LSFAGQVCKIRAVSESEKRTVPHQVPRVPVRTLRLEVLEGPDRGTVFVAESDEVSVGTAGGNDLVLTDETVSRYHMELLRQPDGILVRDHGSTNGTALGDATIREAWIPAGAVLRLGKSSIQVSEGDLVRVELMPGDRFGRLRGKSPVMRKLMSRLEKVAQSDVPILLLGETGTGKELMAEAVHHASPRASGPLEVVDCAALHPTLVASELFGHEKGAFTGADRRHVGAFERAHGGTVFLDEIGDISPEFQASLLGALERRRFKRVGGTEDIQCDVRVVSATHRDLRAEVNAGTFRQDLYYRLAVVLLRVPALRERMEDLPVLMLHFLYEAGFDGELEELIPKSALKNLEAHHFPGNVRELRNLMEATLALGEAPSLSAHETSSERIVQMPEEIFELTYKEARTIVMDQFEARYVKKLLARTDENAALGARTAKMNRSYLFQLIRKHGLRP